MVDISAAQVSARRDTRIEVTIDIANNPGFTSMEFEVFYDADVLTYVKATKGLVAHGTAYITPGNESISVMHAVGTENVEGNDTLVTLTFDVKKDAAIGKSVIRIEPGIMTRLVTNEGEQPYEVDLAANCTEGFVEVTAQMLGDLNLDESVDLEDAVLLLQHSLFSDAYPLDYVGSVDFTKDGSVDLEDAVLLLQHSLFPDAYPIG